MKYKLYLDLESRARASCSSLEDAIGYAKMTFCYDVAYIIRDDTEEVCWTDMHKKSYRCLSDMVTAEMTRLSKLDAIVRKGVVK